MLRKSLIAAFLGMALAGGSAGAQQAGSGNRSNVPFDTVADGLLGPMVGDGPAGATAEAANKAVTQAMRRTKPTGRTAWAVRDFLVRKGLLRPNSALNYSRPVVLRQGGQLVLPDAERARRSRAPIGGGSIQFTYEGFTPDFAQRMDGFIDNLLRAKAEALYGKPAYNINVKIVYDAELGDSRMHLRNGIYNASTNQIRFNPVPNTGQSEEEKFRDDMFFLTHLILYAFHDDAMFAYDAWEEGFTWAATHIIFSSLYPDYDLGGSFKTFYYLPLYELMNQPGIGNPRFWPASFDQLVATQSNAVLPFTLFVFRCGMAAAAWSKVYAESDNHDFFVKFNTAYYQGYNEALPGYIPRLKQIASTYAPNVEGLTFLDWYRRQYILDTAITPGRHVWTYAAPDFNRDDNAGAHITLLIYNFGRDALGNEIPLAGTADLLYYNADYSQDFFTEEPSQVAIPGGTDLAGVGSPSPGIFNVGGAQRISAQITVGGLTRTVPWPYLVRGTAGNPNDFFGVTSHGDNGEVGVIVGTGQEKTAALTNGAFGLQAGMAGFVRTRVEVQNEGGRSITRQVNTGPDFYVAALPSPPPAPQTFTLTVQPGANLISVPGYPVGTDAEALGIAANQLLLAHWDPTLVSSTNAYGYRTYPSTPPLAPGIGYWLMVKAQKTITFQGNPPAQDQSYLIPLRAGWNQIGHPFLKTVSKGSLSVLSGTTDTAQAISLAAAASQGLISGTIWKHTPAAGFTEANSLEPYKGYFVLAQADIFLMVPAVNPLGNNPITALPNGDPIVGDTRGRAAAHRSRASMGTALENTRQQVTDGWRVRVAARVGDAVGSVVVGASRAATDGFDAVYDAPRPPDMGNYVRLGVRHSEWGRAAGDYAIDIRPEGAPKTSWDVNLETNQRNQQIFLSWTDHYSVPKDVRLYLVDLDGGQRRYLRTTGSLVLNSGETGQRRLRIEATRGGASMLAITNLLVTPTRGLGTLDVQFTLSADALVDADVLSPSGRKVRQLTRSRAYTVGANHLPWDGRSDPGVKLAPGMYLLQITATTEEGQSVRALRPVMVTR